MKLRWMPYLLLTALTAGCSSSTAPSNTASSTSTPEKPVATHSAADSGSKVPKGGDLSRPAKASGKTYSIVGTWTVDNPAVKYLQLEFGKDGTLTVSSQLPVKPIKLNGKGTYTIKGSDLKIKMSSATMVALPGATDADKKDIDAQNKAVANGPKPSEQSAIINWVDADDATMTTQVAGQSAGTTQTKTVSLKRKS